MADGQVERTEVEVAAGVTIVADVRGPADGPPVLLHGVGQTRHAWHGTAAALAAAGWRAASLDMRGPARAAGRPTATTGPTPSPPTH